MQRYSDVIIDVNGRPLAGASVTVKLAGTSTLATIYSDNGVTGKANPFASEADGSFDFYAANGRYDVTFSLSGYSFDDSDTSDVLLFDLVNAFNAKGTILVGTGANAYTAQAPGSDRYALVYDSAQTAGVRAKNPWANLFLRM